jgi:hypothetical protein
MSRAALLSLYSGSHDEKAGKAMEQNITRIDSVTINSTSVKPGAIFFW